MTCLWITDSKLLQIRAEANIKETSSDCSCNQACQVWAFLGTPWWSNLENLTIDGKFINKRVWLVIHQKMCREEKNISTS